MPDSEGGFPKGHKENCACPACAGHRTAEERHRAEAEQVQTRSDVAWLTVMRAGGPDAVIALARQHGDPQRAVRLLQAGGFDVAGITSRWRAEAPHATQRSSKGNPWAGVPEHSDEAMAALASGGGAAYRAKVAELTAARDAGKQARQQPAVMWRTRSGELVVDGDAPVMGVSFGPDGAPVQGSRVSTGVPELGSEQ